MQTRSQTRQKNEEPNPVIQKAMQFSFHRLKTEPVPSAAISSKDDTKQEKALDTKAKNEETVASVNSIFGDVSAVIKTEPMDVHLKQQIETKGVPDLHGDAYYYSCRSCNQTRASLKSLLDHRKEAHLKRRRKNCPIKHVTLEPDIDDANHYCQTCEKRFFTRQHYKQHLNFTHHMVIIKSSRQQSHQQSRQQDDKLKGAQPSINKFNHYCKPCQLFYCSQSSYDTHVFVAHSTSSSSLQSNTTTTTRQRAADTAQSPAENRYCSICNKMVSKDYFELHTTLLHTTHEPFTKKSRVALKPNINDSDHYCSVCQQKFDSKSMYHDHLQDIHNMALQCLVPKDPTILPNPHNRCNYCRVCKRTMTSRALYRLHCKYSHFMVLEPLDKSRVTASRFA